MTRDGRGRLLAAAACCAAGTGWVLAGPATAGAQRAPRAAVVEVTLGKPSEFGVTLSRLANLPLGTIAFRVTNEGKAPHDFKVCSTPARTSATTTCRGKVTRLLDAGQSATLLVTFTRGGTYEFLSDVAGRAGLGMKGLLGVGVSAPEGGTSTDTLVPDVAQSGRPAATCSSPSRMSTVVVEMREYSFVIREPRIPCGLVTFVETNEGTIDHNADIVGAAGGAGPVIHAGDKARFTVSLVPGTYAAQCDMPGHAALGMVGEITVTG